MYLNICMTKLVAKVLNALCAWCGCDSVYGYMCVCVWWHWQEINCVGSEHIGFGGGRSMKWEGKRASNCGDIQSGCALFPTWVLCKHTTKGRHLIRKPPKKIHLIELWMLTDCVTLFSYLLSLHFAKIFSISPTLSFSFSANMNNSFYVLCSAKRPNSM